MRWLYAPEYDYGRNLVGLHDVHGFLLDKPSRIRRHLVTADVAALEDFERPEPVDGSELRSAHEEIVVLDLYDPGAVARAVEFDDLARLSQEAMWEALVVPQLYAAGGTCVALRAACEGEWAINLSGGFHHARPDPSHGFCLVNDLALAIRRLRRDALDPRVLVIDLDLHQGDGNATFFGKDDRVFTFSMHEQGVFPLDKVASDLDAGQPDVGDAEYLTRLDTALDEIGERTRPEIIVYLAGSDPFVLDPHRSLRLTLDGMLERDRRVARFARAAGSALVTLPAGGYSDESPSLTAAGFAEIARVEAGWPAPLARPSCSPR